MSHNREWDYGKDWDSGDRRGYTRTRDDDEYYSEGKRRKYNNGGHEESQWLPRDDTRTSGHNGYGHHDHPDNYNNFGHNQSFDNRDVHSSRDRGFGGFQPRKKHVASEPSPHVIFLGLDADFTEADLQNFLKGRACVVETVTIIRDRNTGQSKGFGFAQFGSTEEARSFVDPNFPFISVPPPASYGASAAAAFKRAEETGAQHAGKRVKIDYSQSANTSGQGRRGPQFSNDGTRDIGNTQSAVLLFRGLDPQSGPAAIAQAIKSSVGSGKDAKGMKRVLVIKDKATMASWGYAFVEFTDVQAASAVLAATMSPQLHPNGFRISDRPVAASFAHPYSFQPIADNMYQDDSCIPSSLNLGGVEGTSVKYWDEASTIAAMEFKVEVVEHQQHAASGKDRKDKEKKKPKASGENSVSLAEASALPMSNKPVTLSFNKVASAAKTPLVSTVPISSQTASLFSLNDENDGEDGVSNNKNVEGTANAKVKQAQKVPPMIASKKVVDNITKWNQVQDELNCNSSEPTIVATIMKARTVTPDVEIEFEFSDTKAMTCLLCSRQFKSLDQLKRHNKDSDLHKKNFNDANLREVAREKAHVARGKEQTPPAQSALKAHYRDRAYERRTLFNQPDVPLPESSQAKAVNKRSAEGPPAPQSPPPPPVAPAKDEGNIGNKLLKMMGWTEGRGLGAEGGGRVDPIQTAIYTAGAGLGASKGREVGKYQEGYSGYVQMAKDVARERYEV